LLSAWTPWIAASAPGAAATAGLAASTTSCTAKAPGPATGPGSCTGISVGIVPYAPGDHFGADFQSSPGSGGNAPITVTFSNPVSSVTITIEDPGPPGNTMTAYRANGSVAGRVRFTGCGCSGINIPDTRSITAAGIVRILLTPAPLDYVAYKGLTFTPSGPCKDSMGNPVPCPDMQTAIKTLQDSAHAKSQGQCAHNVRIALDAGGLDTGDRPDSAKYYGAFLQRHGAVVVTSDHYQAQAGDIAVFLGNADHPAGHVQMYDGSVWISDFKQPSFDPYSRAHPGGASTIYRFPGH
jgi:hypothetical protein